MGRYDQSRGLRERAVKILPCNGAQTLSKSPARNPKAYPVYIDRGEGSRVWDVDGNEFIDYMAALGPIALGYNYPAVTEAVIQQARKGVLFSLEHPLVMEVAEMLTQMIPGAEMVRFVKSGSTAVSAAVRVARAFTNRDLVLVASDSYHGQDNWFQATQERGKHGVPANELENISQFTYNDVNSLTRALELAKAKGGAAAVILEPARTFMAKFDFLQAAKRLCQIHGALLIFDEVVTFGRFPGLTYGAYSKVIPDLTVLGKAMGNGYAIGAVVGRRDVMEAFNTCFISGTYHGELTGMAAAKACLTVLRDEPVVEHLTRQGQSLMNGYNAAMDRYDLPGKADGIPVCWRPSFHGDQAETLRLLFMQECAQRGILPGLITYVGYSHTDEDIQRTIQIYYEVAELLDRWQWSPDLASHLEV